MIYFRSFDHWLWEAHSTSRSWTTALHSVYWHEIGSSWLEKCCINLQHTEWGRQNGGCCTSSIRSYFLKLKPEMLKTWAWFVLLPKDRSAWKLNKFHLWFRITQLPSKVLYGGRLCYYLWSSNPTHISGFVFFCFFLSNYFLLPLFGFPDVVQY